jgi:hypothetical protein
VGGPQARSSSAGLDTSRRSPAPNLPARNCPVPFCGVGLVAAKMNSQRIHLRKIFRTNVSFTITGTGASFVALSGSAALSLGCGSQDSFAFSRFARAISLSSAWSSRFSKPRNFGCRPLGRLTFLLVEGVRLAHPSATPIEAAHSSRFSTSGHHGRRHQPIILSPSMERRRCRRGRT